MTINGCHFPSANAQRDRFTEDKMRTSEGGTEGPCHLAPSVCPFPHKPTFQELESTWTCLLCQAASHFECYFGGRMCRNSLKILLRIVQMPELLCRYPVTIDGWTISRKLSALIEFTFTLCSFLQNQEQSQKMLYLSCRLGHHWLSPGGSRWELGGPSTSAMSLPSPSKDGICHSDAKTFHQWLTKSPTVAQ